MKRQLERKRRQREHTDEALLNLVNWVSKKVAAPSTPSSASAASLPTLAPELVKSALLNVTLDGFVSGENLSRLCEEAGCNVSDLLRIVRTVPRSVSTETQIVESELSFAVLRILAPVEVRQRRMLSSVGDVGEGLPVVDFYKHKFAWTTEEWAAFLASLSTPLPMTFRVHRSEPALSAMADYFIKHAPHLSQTVTPVDLFSVAGQRPASPVSMFGCSHDAYHSCPEAEHWARSLHAANCVSFQEVVSALPVAVLQPSAGMAVLDMCAAPGSKSLQILDSIIHCDFSTTRDSVVWLNEKDRTKATQTLPARVKRYHAPNVIVSRCDATQLPRMYSPSGAQDSATTLVERHFDRIICDVPCSGDGTIRKERSVVASWSPEYVSSLVVTQKSLLRRAVDLLAVGGIVVYSTCSMNPAEDEEVVESALATFADCCELMDVRSALKEFCGVPDVSLFTSSLHPEAAPQCSLVDPQKVLRVFPNVMNTGGFFVAAIRKVCPSKMTPPAASLGKLNQWMNHRRWVRVSTETDEHWRSIVDFFGVSEASERLLLESYRPVFHVNPNGGPQRRIALITPAVEDMMFQVRPFKGPGVEIVTMGVRAFEAYDGKFLSGARCRWRAVAESASRFSRFATKRMIRLQMDQHRDVLQSLFASGSVELNDSLVALLFSDAEWWCIGGSGNKELLVGCVLIGVEGGPAQLHDDRIWWLSATVSYRKIELAVDESVRNFGLFALFGIRSDDEGNEPSVPGE